MATMSSESTQQGHRQQARRHLVIGTRTSRLAMWQSEFVAGLLLAAWPQLTYELRPFQTKGDRTLDRPLPQIGGKGLFTAELEQALLDNEIDLAVHSLKDLPVHGPPGLTIGAIPQREEAGDALISRGDVTLKALRPGAIVGTSSLRRGAQILALRPDLGIEPMRGNVETRIGKVEQGQYDAAILACAGINRLGLATHLAARLPMDEMLPAPGQGALAVQCRAGDGAILELLQAIDHAPTRAATSAERHFLQALGGGCSAPIAAYAAHYDGLLAMEGLVAAPDGSRVIRVSGHGSQPMALAERLADEARARGAGQILEGHAAAPQEHAPKPLDGLRVVVTRSKQQAAHFAARLRQLGAIPILFPTIEIEPLADTRRLDQAIASLPSYDWVIFTSVNGVKLFGQRLEALSAGSELFEGIQVAAIGPATAAALREIGVAVHFVPGEFVAERIAEGLGNVAGKRILLPRAQQARAELVHLLRWNGALVDEIATYRTLPGAPDASALAQLASADVVTFTSASTVEHFVTLVGGRAQAAKLLSSAAVACIGPITAANISALGVEPQFVPAEYTIDGLLDVLIAYRRFHYKSS